MAKLVITVDIPDHSLDPFNYPDLETPSAVEMLEYSISQIDDVKLTESELLDMVLDCGGIAEFEALP